MKKLRSLSVITGVLFFNASFCTDTNESVQVKDHVVPVDTAVQQDDAQMAVWKIEALQVARAFLNLVDGRKYAESWLSASPLFQRTMKQKEWVVVLNLAHDKLGALKTRTLRDERPAWDPKGLPKGPYMVVEYDSSFEKVPKLEEELTLRREPTGQWKVLTYRLLE